MTAPNIADLRVLLVDDNVVVRKLIEMQLTNMGFANIDSASNSNEAQEKISVTAYDIVFLDWNMPGKSGYTLMQEYREDRQYDHIAFVMVTAESQERYTREALKAGATMYITKPIAPATFKEKIERVLAWIESNRAAKTG
ncbi:MAG: CheY chemotaxis protein [Alphaproteobacteria bacterium]|jgi:two-component system phosphate regulon response regulator PhoB|nr:CheY chemotaxis protein [Alphaproteobacteria bacterium]